MKQQTKIVEISDAKAFESTVNKYLDDGYIISSTCISRSWANTPDEGAVYRAILVKEIKFDLKEWAEAKSE